ncbi:MAG: gliding motility-associated C-terminal domain-containing protein [Bacteroidales bacterium]|nr:gliding motility-associated C-terminal domain-containing protein [Bacteroidales bacterium]
MSSDKKYNNQEPDTSKIDSFSSQSSMKTPEGYFENFPARMGNITKNIPAESIGKTILQHAISHPWIAAAAAAVVGALIVGTVLITNQNGSDQNPKPTTAAADSHNIEKPKKAPDKNAYSINKQHNSNQNKQDTNNSDSTPSSALANNKSDSPPTSDTAKDTSKKANPENSNQKLRDHEQRGQYVQNDNQETMYKPPEAIRDHAYTGGNNQQKTSTANDNASDTIPFFADTCIDTPTWFVLPDIPRGYTIEWQTNNDRKDSLLINESGTYTAILYDKNNSRRKKLNFYVTYLPKPRVTLRQKHSGCINKDIRLDPGIYSTEYRYKWSDGVKSPVNFVSSREADKQKYILKVEGCKTYTYQTVVVFEPCNLTIPNVITPNGDGINDCFIIQGLSNYPGSKLIILNRNGQILYESNNYQNDFEGGNLPEGSYYYILRINDKNQTTKKGNLNIIK